MPPTDLAPADQNAPDSVAPGHDEHHVSDWVFIKVAIILGILTGIEVFTYFESVHNMSDELLIGLLCVLMVLKFFLVAAYFMHLKYDNAIFTKAIVAGLVLAYPVYMIFALTFGFLDGWHWAPRVLTLAAPPIVTAAWLLFAWQGPSEKH